MAVGGGPGGVRPRRLRAVVGAPIGLDPPERDEGVGDPLAPQLVCRQIIGGGALGALVDADRRCLLRGHAPEHLGGQLGVRRHQAGFDPGGRGERRALGDLRTVRAGPVGESAQLDSDLGLSSLDRVELLSALEDRYQVDLNETRFASLNTVGDLERMLKGETAQRAVYHYSAWAQRWPTTWMRFAIHYLLLRPAVFLLGWPRITGRENLRGISGPVLVISNHIGDVDVGFIQTALPFRLRHQLATAAGGEALEALRTPPAGRNLFLRIFDRVEWFLGVSLLNLFPLPREAGFRDSFAFAGESVDRGYSILVFPEGHHTTDGQLRSFRSGIGLLANNLKVPVVPVRIDGLFELKKAGKRVARPFRITVKVGKPVKFEAGHEPAQIAAELQKRVETL